MVLLSLLLTLPLQEKDSVQFPAMRQPLAISKLSGQQMYVIASDLPCFVLSSPAGLVSVSEEQGPIKIRGMFVDGDKVETRTYRQKQVFIIEASGKGNVELLVVIVGKTKPDDVLRKTLYVDAQMPIPPPPQPPDPPMPPDPPPSPAPIPLPGLRVLIVIEEMEANKLTAGQRATIYGVPMRDWLDSKCVVGTDGKTKEWRIFDKDVRTDSAEKHWRDVMQRRPASVPWLIVSNGKAGYEGPLPGTPEETKALIQRFAEK